MLLTYWMVSWPISFATNNSMLPNHLPLGLFASPDGRREAGVRRTFWSWGAVPLRQLAELTARAEIGYVREYWRRGRDSPRPLKIKAKPLVLRIGLEFSQLYWGLFSAI